LLWLLDLIEPAREAILATAQQYGADADFSVGWFSATGQGGPDISAPTLERIASFNAYLGFDIYDMSRDDDDDEVAALLDELDQLVHRAKPIPLTTQIRVERREIDDLLDRLRSMGLFDDDHLWYSSVADLRQVPDSPGAMATADLLEHARPKWEGKVVARTSPLGIRFTRPEDRYPWETDVLLERAGDAFVFYQRRDSQPITTDRATDETADAVLDAFLTQLTST